jgi:hypothetical protein
MQLRPHSVLSRVARPRPLNNALPLLPCTHVRALARPRERTIQRLPARSARTNHARGPHHTPDPYPHLHPQGIGRGNPQHRPIKPHLSGMGKASPSQMRTRLHPMRISRRHVTPTHRPTRRKRRPRTTTSRDRRPHPRPRRGRHSPPAMQPITRRTHRIRTRKSQSRDDKKKIEHAIERTDRVFKRAAHHSRRPSPLSPRQGRGRPRRARTGPNIPGWVHLAQIGN